MNNHNDHADKHNAMNSNEYHAQLQGQANEQVRDLGDARQRERRQHCLFMSVTLGCVAVLLIIDACYCVQPQWFMTWWLLQAIMLFTAAFVPQRAVWRDIARLPQYRSERRLLRAGFIGGIALPPLMLGARMLCASDMRVLTGISGMSVLTMGWCAIMLYSLLHARS